MSSITIRGSRSLSGEVFVHGSKNTVLPILAASLLNAGLTILRNCPKITDVLNMIDVLRDIGCMVEWNNNDLLIDASNVRKTIVNKEMAVKCRGSIIFLGALLARRKRVVISRPGGCSIGERKINYHVDALRELGARIVGGDDKDEFVYAGGKNMKAGVIQFPFPSVGATENALLATVLLEGTSVIYNAAKEPEIRYLCEFLVGAGANITGIGTETLVVRGVKQLHDSVYKVPPDRIVAGTYLAAVAAVGGTATIHGVVEEDLYEVIRILRKMGCMIEINDQVAKVERKGALVSPGTIVTEPFPGFPTDMQSQFMVLFSIAEGTSYICEEIFEKRFQIIQELNKLGADIRVTKQEVKKKGTHNYTECIAVVKGNRNLQGAEVYAKELRGAAALIVAGLCSEGETIVRDVDYVNRGYIDICKDLSNLSAILSFTE